MPTCEASPLGIMCAYGKFCMVDDDGVEEGGRWGGGGLGTYGW